MTGEIPESFSDKKVHNWPRTSISEINSLVTNFVKMTNKLDDNFAALQRQAQLLWEAKEKAQVTLHSIGDAVIVTNSKGEVEYFNPIAERLTGWSLQDGVGRSLLEIFNIFNETTGLLAENPVEKCLREKRVVGLANHTSLLSKDGLQFSIEDSAAPIVDSEGEILGVVLVFHDVSDKKRLMDEIVHQAFHDSLTGLPNRALFNDRLSQAIAVAKRTELQVAVLFIDLDHFKLINDMLGHSMGDMLLVEVADRLSGFVRESDTLARLGGDEFTIILTQLKNGDDADVVAEQILEILGKPFMMKDQQFHISASIGIAIYPFGGEDPQTLMRNADTAMYRAKELGRNTFTHYADSMNEKVQERVQLENALRQALENEEFMLYFQPMVDMRTDKIMGVEALVRWEHPEQGIISPLDFVPLAEDIGLIVPIGEWVLKKACTQNKAWQDAGYEPIKVSVNLSARQLQKPDFVEDVVRILEGSGMDPSYLELEITESVAMQDIEKTIRILQQLGNLGIQFAIDDFGTGYCSLNYLRLFPIHTLKIDRSFIRDIDMDEEDAAIVTTIIVLGQNLHLSVIAEGVENASQVEFLKERKCYNMQGFYFGKPIPEEKLKEMLRFSIKI